MRLVETSNTDVSGASEVPQSRGKLFLLGSPAAVFWLKNRSRSSKFVSIKIDRNTKVQAITTSSTIDWFLTKFFTLIVMN